MCDAQQREHAVGSGEQRQQPLGTVWLCLLTQLQEECGHHRFQVGPELCDVQVIKQGP